MAVFKGGDGYARVAVIARSNGHYQLHIIAFDQVTDVPKVETVVTPNGESRASFHGYHGEIAVTASNRLYVAAISTMSVH